MFQETIKVVISLYNFQKIFSGVCLRAFKVIVPLALIVQKQTPFHMKNIFARHWLYSGHKQHSSESIQQIASILCARVGNSK